VTQEDKSFLSGSLSARFLRLALARARAKSILVEEKEGKRGREKKIISNSNKDSGLVED
jgi:hypothetical protein